MYEVFYPLYLRNPTASGWVVIQAERLATVGASERVCSHSLPEIIGDMWVTMTPEHRTTPEKALRILRAKLEEYLAAESASVGVEIRVKEMGLEPIVGHKYVWHNKGE